MNFETIEGLEEWLEPFDYETFWHEIEPYCLTLKSQDDCDTAIEHGLVTEDDVLGVLKMLTRVELTRILKLKHRDDFPVITWH